MNMLLFFILRESPPLKAVSDVMAENGHCRENISIRQLSHDILTGLRKDGRKKTPYMY